MGTKLTGGGVEKTYAAAQQWVQRALRTDDSLFTPGKAIWSSRWLEEVRRRFLDQPATSGNNFFERLQSQLEDSQPEVYQLVGEALYFYFLIVHTQNSAGEQERIDRVLGWSPSPVAIPQDLVDGLTPGIVTPGQNFHSRRHFQVGFLIEFVGQWKDQEPDEQRRLLADPWDFKDFAASFNGRSSWLQNHPKSFSTQREALLHLVFPDTFEPIVSLSHKGKIAEAFSRFVTKPTEDIDRQLAQIRPRLEAQYELENALFYQTEIKNQWDPKSPPIGVQPPSPLPPPPPNDPWAPDKIEELAKEFLWEPRDLQKIIDGLQDKRQAIFQGPPGTGKTYVAKRIAEWCQEHGGGFQIVQFHPSYAYEDFVEGFRPRLTGDGQAGFVLTNGPLRNIAEKAKNRPDDPFILVIDEINRGNVAKVLGELYFLLEYRDEEVSLQYSNEGFSLPQNLWFIGTMNTTDRSIALVDAALRRRFYFFNFFPDQPPVKGLLERWLEENDPDGIWVADLVDRANAKLKDRHLGIGPSHFMKKNRALDEERVRLIWEQAVIPYIEEQSFGDEEQLKEFSYEQLMGEIGAEAAGPNSVSSEPGGAAVEGAGQTENGAGDATS